jgi:hypothetical protein
MGSVSHPRRVFGETAVKAPANYAAKFRQTLLEKSRKQFRKNRETTAKKNTGAVRRPWLAHFRSIQI